MSGAPASTPEGSGAFYEIRRYRAHPGRRADLVRVMEDQVLPFMTEKGMDVTASFIDEQDPDAYVWIRRFAHEQDRVARCAAVYEHPRWSAEIGPAVLALMDASAAVVTRAVPTSASPLQ